MTAPTHRRRLSAACLLPVLALLGAAGCVDDEFWVDRISIELEAPANRAVVLSQELQEGNLRYYESTVVDDSLGFVLAEVEGSGSHTVELLTDTPDQRANLLIIAWADDPDAGEPDLPDCEEEGTRILPDLDLDEAFVIPSDEYPIAWCGALLGS
jgi:hypothetical protein